MSVCNFTNTKHYSLFSNHIPHCFGMQEIRIRLFADTLSAKKIFADTLSTNKKLFADTLPASRKFICRYTIPYVSFPKLKCLLL